MNGRHRHPWGELPLGRRAAATGTLLCMLLGPVAIPSPPASAATAEAPAPVQPSAEPAPATPDGADSEPFNPFADWQTHELDNGLRVWLKAWPGAEQSRASLSLPVGGAHDPDGLEGLAHYLEHVLFTSVPGQTEAEFKTSLTDRGGTYNGHTSRYKTRYWSQLPSDEWRFGVQWVQRVVFDKAFSDENTRAQLEPILIEGGDKLDPRGFEEFLGDIMDPDWVEVPGFVEREYGLKTDDDPVLGTWGSLHRIEPSDVEAFHARHYGPENMRLVVAGDFDPDEALAYVEELFGAFPRGLGREPYRKAAGGKERYRIQYGWKDSKEASYSFSAKLHDLDARGHVMALLLGNMARKHLREVLRWGEDKAVYSIKRRLKNVFGSRTLTISARCTPEDLDRVRREVLDIFERLATGDEPELFEGLRDQIVADQRRYNQTPSQLLKNWVEASPYLYADVIPAMPDVLGIAEALTAAELAAWMNEHLRHDRTVESVTRPAPITDDWSLVEVFVMFWLVLLLARRFVATPVDLTTLRYLRKLRYPAAQWLVCLVVWLMTIGLIAGGREWTANRAALLLGFLDSYPIRVGLGWMFSLVMIACWLALGTLVPRKVLLFEDHWRIKFWSWRSLARPYSAIREVEVASLLSLWRRRRLLTLSLAASPFRRGVYLRLGPRFGLLLHTREPAELAEQLRLRVGAGENPPQDLAS